MVRSLGCNYVMRPVARDWTEHEKGSARVLDARIANRALAQEAGAEVARRRDKIHGMSVGAEAGRKSERAFSR